MHKEVTAEGRFDFLLDSVLKEDSQQRTVGENSEGMLAPLSIFASCFR